MKSSQARTVSSTDKNIFLMVEAPGRSFMIPMHLTGSKPVGIAEVLAYLFILSIAGSPFPAVNPNARLYNYKYHYLSSFCKNLGCSIYCFMLLFPKRIRIVRRYLPN